MCFVFPDYDFIEIIFAGAGLGAKGIGETNVSKANSVAGPSTIASSNPYSGSVEVFIGKISNNITGLDLINSSNNFNIYPNPATNMISIDFAKAQKDCSLKIYDLNGMCLPKRSNF